MREQKGLLFHVPSEWEVAISRAQTAEPHVGDRRIVLDGRA